ncbi:putative subunit of trafficking protein particle complex [Hamiltosporidium tvaerminnensis]|uniref:Putative subunit of trafficking protein particle complex n=1 Tax=Hamiltosporidium tvaerminnensis TaxID=1176355 RepID=A0A4Q9LZX7_9MICR|nr:putative subunit of trafficking protein particle complex [Hamiltosporidium tvaerminnensis]
MDGKSSEKISADFFTHLYGATVKHLLNENEDSNDILINVGEKIGNRLIDDYFYRINCKKTMNIKEVANNICDTFFPLYLGYSPQLIENNGIFSIKFESFYLLKFIDTSNEEIFSKKNVKFLNMFVGILKSVYSYLSSNKIVFTDNSDKEFIISVSEVQKKENESFVILGTKVNVEN